MKYLINSNKNFASKSLRILIPSLLDCGIMPDDILVVIGGSNENSEDFHETGMYKCLNVKFNSIDQNCFYAMKRNEKIFQDDHYFYMHDTTKAGPRFKESVDLFFDFFKTNDLNTMRIVDGFSGNMGFYKKYFILRTLNEMECYLINEEIMTDENNANDPEKVTKRKIISYDLEDKMFSYNWSVFGNNYCISLEPLTFKEKRDVYGTGNERIVRHLEKIDLYKFSGNITFGEEQKHLNTSIGIKI